MPHDFRDPERPAVEKTDESYLPVVPRAILSRHGARVLDPTTRAVAVAPDVPAPLPTAYLANSLLVPKDVLPSLGAINNELAKIGLELLPPRGQGLTDLPRPATLRVKADGQPGTVDAWAALQHLRASPIRTIAQRITMEHLLFGADLMWSGVEGAYSPNQPPPTSKGTAAAASSYIRSRDGGRLPVVLFTADPPPRRKHMTRRPVVAVLDSGISTHPWFDKPSPAAGGDSFVAVDPTLQNALSNNSGLQPNDLRHFDEQTVVPDTLTGELDSHWGHGTFITGIIRQAAPDAQVLAIRVMYSDGVAHEGDILYALRAIANRVADAQQNNKPDHMIDIVSLSLGYYPEDTRRQSQAVTSLVDELTGMGVLVCAGAGNGSTTRLFYPAALADVSDTIQNRVISVGALNPNGSKALFSNDGSWVRCWAPGASVVSTFPLDNPGSLGPDHTMQAKVPDGLPKRRDALDDDDFSCGFAVWNGTSFAAPMVAARLAKKLLEQSESTDGLGRDVTLESTKKRAADTLNAVVKGVSDYVWPE
jgi:subtilisin family serine protease